MLELYLQIRHLYQLTHSNSENINSYYKVIQTTFQNVLHDEKFNAEDVMNLINISTNDDVLRKCDNFEIHDLMNICHSIKELVNFKISSFEGGSNEAVKNE